MEIKIYRLNDEKRKFLEKKIKSFRQTRVLGSLGFLLLNFLFIASFELEFGNAVVSYGVLSSLTTATCVFLGNNAALKLYKVVQKIELNDDEILMETNNKRVTVPLNSVRFEDGWVTIIDKNEKALTCTHQGFSYQIITEFYENDLVDDFRERKLLRNDRH